MDSISEEDLEQVMRMFMTCVDRAAGSRPENRDYKAAIGSHPADTYLSVLERSAKNLERELNSHIFKHRRSRNQRLPLYRLPNEILLRILFLSLQTPYSSQFSQLHNLAQVSVRWAQLVRGSPMLFGYATSDDIEEDANRTLCLSRNALLDVKYDLDWFGSTWKEAFLDRLLQHNHRWRSIELVGLDTTKMNSVLREPMPQLQDLDIFCRIQEEGFHVINLSPEKLRQLRHLTLTNVSPQWDASMLRGLVTLELDSNDPTGLLKVSQLLDILLESQGLRILNLGHKAVHGLHSRKHAPFGLPHLATLSLIQIPVNTAYDIMKCVRIHNCARLTIRCIQGEPPRTAGFFDSKTAHLEVPIRSILASLTRVIVSLSWLIVECSGLGVGAELDIYLPILQMPRKPNSVSWLERIHSSLASPPDISLYIIAPEGAEKRPPMLKKSSSSVTSLDIYDGQSETDRWMKHLGTPTVIDGFLKWPLPSLKVLRLGLSEGVLKGEGLLNMVKTRYGGEHGNGGRPLRSQDELEDEVKMLGDERREEDHGQVNPRTLGGSRDSRMSERPVSLDSLEILGSTDLDYDEMKEIEDIIGVDNVVWHQSEDEIWNHSEDEAGSGSEDSFDLDGW
ncbi:hypothetical protein FRB95_007149 [Tulasnella sp. JGI-2019a]|nr:hypothetical protein FRB95_007149 [Tulasnella sp. JGI-2019a]